MRLFSIEEANSLLPQLRRLLGEIKTARVRITALAPEARAAGERADQNGAMRGGALYVQALSAFGEAIQSIGELGVEIKDLDKGLCDFPHLRDGRVVYLCWLLGEDSIEYWHDTDAGFAGRQPL